MHPCPLPARAPGPTGRALAAQLTVPIPLQGDNGEGDPGCAGSPGLPGPPGLPGQRGEEVGPGPHLGRAPRGLASPCKWPSVPRGSFIPARCPPGPSGGSFRGLSVRSSGASCGSEPLALVARWLLLARRTPFRPCQPLPVPAALLQGSSLPPPRPPLLNYHFRRETFPDHPLKKLTMPHTVPRNPSPLHAVRVSPSEYRVFHSFRNSPHVSTEHESAPVLFVLAYLSPGVVSATRQGFLCSFYCCVPSTWTSAWDIIAAQ